MFNNTVQISFFLSCFDHFHENIAEHLDFIWNENNVEDVEFRLGCYKLMILDRHKTWVVGILSYCYKLCECFNFFSILIIDASIILYYNNSTKCVSPMITDHVVSRCIKVIKKKNQRNHTESVRGFSNCNPLLRISMENFRGVE